MSIRESVDHATTDLFAHTEQVARDHGLVPPPMVWAFDPALPDPLIGCARSRAFYKGRDAVHAIERLGLFPGAYAAPLVMVAWEQADLCSALELDEVDSLPSIVTVIASSDGSHQVTMYPFRYRVLGSLPSGSLSLAIDWQPDIDLRDADLPPPITYLLGHWITRSEQRHAAAGPDHRTGQVIAELHAQGYSVDLNHDAAGSPRTA